MRKDEVGTGFVSKIMILPASAPEEVSVYEDYTDLPTKNEQNALFLMKKRILKAIKKYHSIRSYLIFYLQNRYFTI